MIFFRSSLVLKLTSRCAGYVGLLTLGLWTVACGKSEPQPNVIIIVADTLRADHLKCYGYGRETSPNLDALAAQATLYENANSAASYTLPAHASMFTGQLPMTHMAQTYLNSDGFRFEKGDLVHRPLASEFFTLAEAFGEIGYRTAGFAANTVFVSERTGLTQGFDEYFNERMTGEELNAEVLPWIEKRKNKPFFLFLNYMDTHEKYNTKKVDGFLEHASGEKVAGQLLKELYPIIMKEQTPPPDRLQLHVDAYDLSIRNLDNSIGELVAKLRQLQIYDNTLIVFTADHGEFHGEHNYLTHWKDVYEQVLHVPLMVKAPLQSEGSRVTERISTVSVPRLIIDSLGDEELDEFRAGFLPAIRRDATLAESRFSHEKDYYDPEWGHRFQRVRTAFYEDNFKFVYSTDGKHELYDLAADPEEKSNVIASHPELVARLQGELEHMIAESPTPPTVMIDPADQNALPDKKEMESLEDLGYL